jgi:hypothetical protein
MPDRVVRAGILTSESVNRLSWAAEVFYRRLINVVDDYGRYDGRAAILRAVLYPLKIDRVSDRDVETWMREVAETGLLKVYTVDGKRFVEIAKFDQRLRAKSSKWPHPPSSADTCQHVTANATETETETESSTESSTESKTICVEPRCDSSPVFIAVPLVDKSEHPITEAQVADWEEAYPAVDVPQKLREIRQWNIANPTKRKTRKGILRHITDWLAREQDRGGKRHETHQPIDNSAIGKVRRANAQARAARNTLDGDAERIDG